MIFLGMAPGNLQQTGWPTELIFGLLLGWFLLLAGFGLMVWFSQRSRAKLESSYLNLRENETRLLQYLEALPFGTAVVGTDLSLHWINRGFSRLFTLSGSHECPDSLKELFYRHPVYRAGSTEPYPLDKFLAENALKGQAARVEDIELECEDGRIPLALWSEPLLGNHQQVVAALIVCQDIGARRQHEQELDRHIQELQLLVDLRLEQLRNEHEDRVKLESILHRLVTTDSLTGLLNFLHWSSVAERYLQQAVRYRHPLSLILIDIDHFKYVNDSYGEQMGDETLIRIATILRDNLRNVDLLARYRGDQFILLLPDTDQSGAEVLAERLRGRVSNLMIECSKGPVAVTISIGLTGLYPGETQSLQQLIDQADLALYGAKHSGRNRVMAYSPMEVA